MKHHRTKRKTVRTHRVLRRLLELDRPFPPLDDAQVAAEASRNFSWNFWANMLDGVAFWASMTFMSAGTILPLFVSKLTPNPLAIGLLASIAQAGWFLPQLFTANIVSQLPRKKAMVVNLGLLLERLPIWVLMLAPLFALRAPGLALLVVLLAYTWHIVGGGIVAISWQDMFAKIFPVERRGRFFGIMNFAGTIVGIVASGITARLLESQPFPQNYFYIFLLAAVCIGLSWIFLALIREPPQPSHAPPQSQLEFMKRLPEVMRQDKNFRNFMLSRFMLALGGMGGGFLAIAAIQRWQLPDSTAGLYTGANYIGSALGGLLFGFLADRFGHVRNLVIGAAIGALGFALAWGAPTPGWFYAVFLILGLSSGAVFISGMMVVMEFGAPVQRPMYIGLANTQLGAVSLIAPMIGALIARDGYSPVFLVSALGHGFAAIMMLVWVRDPRWHRSPITI